MCGTKQYQDKQKSWIHSNTTNIFLRSVIGSVMSEAAIIYPVHESTASSAQNRDGLVYRPSHNLSGHLGLTSHKRMVPKLQPIFAEIDSLSLNLHALKLFSLPSGPPFWFGLVAQFSVHESYFFLNESHGISCCQGVTGLSVEKSNWISRMANTVNLIFQSSIEHFKFD